MFLTNLFRKKAKNEDENFLFEENINLTSNDLLKKITIPQNSDSVVNPQEQAESFEIISEIPKTEVVNQENFNELTENKMEEQNTNKIVELLSNIAGHLTPKSKEVEVEMVAKTELEQANLAIETLKSEFEAFKSEKETELKDALEKFEQIKSEKEALEVLIQEVKEKEEAAIEEATVAKYVAEAKDYPALVGTVEEIALKIREVKESNLSEELKEQMLSAMKSKNEENSQLMTEVGSEVTDNSELTAEQKAEKELYEKAEKLAAEQNITVQQAVYKINKNLV